MAPLERYSRDEDPLPSEQGPVAGHEGTGFLGRRQLVALAARAKNSPLIDMPLRYFPLGHNRAVRQLAAFREAPYSQYPALVDQLTHGALERARRTSYGQAFGSNIADWPILQKETVRGDVERFVSPWRLRVPAATGGTTGIPLHLWRSLGCVAAEQAFLGDALGSCGLNLARARVAILRGDVIKEPQDRAPPFAMSTHWGRRLVLSAAHLGRDTIDWYVEALNRFRPDVLITYPNQGLNLVRLAGAGAISVPLVMTSSETLATSVRHEISGGLSARVIDHYGQAERVCLAIGVEEGSYRFVPAYGRVELIPGDDDPVEAGCRHVRIIATGFWNDAMSLVRYDTGDRAVVPAGADAATLAEIALGIVPFQGIAGRNDEFVLAQDGTRLCGLNQLPREVAGLLQIQIIQETPTEIVLRALPGNGFGEAARRQLMANARARLPPSMEVSLHIVDALERNAAGKTPLVIRRNP